MSQERPWSGTELAIDVVALYCPEESAALAELRADALALWAVRVLDVHGDWRLIASEPVSVRVYRGSLKTLIFWGATPDAARIAAAEALAPELGDKCPKRPA